MSDVDWQAREALVEQLAEAIAVGKANAALTGENPLGELLDVIEAHIAAKVEAAVSVVRAEAHAEVERHAADIEDAWAAINEVIDDEADEGTTIAQYVRRIARRALLAPSPAEGTGEAGYNAGLWGTPPDLAPYAPAPVSSGEAHITQWGIELTDGMTYGVAPSTREEAERCAAVVPGAKVREVRNCDWAGVTLYDVPAPVVTPSAEGSES